MATWKKVVLSGSAAQLSSLSLGTALPATSGGTGFSSYTTGDLLYANSTTSLVKLGIGSNGQVLGLSGGVPAWTTDQTGTLNSVTSATTGQLTVSSPTANSRALTIVTGAVTNGGTALATGDQIHTFATANFSNNVGTVTGVSATGTVNGMSLSSDGDSATPTLSLTGTLSGIANSALSNSAITIGSTSVSLGATATSFSGLTGLNFTAADASIAASIGANTLTIGGATSTVRIPGDFRVAGTASFTDAATLEITDKVILLSSGSTTANAGGFIVQQASNGSGQFFGYDNSTSGGRFGFQSSLSDNTTPVITQYVPTVQVDSSAPSSAPTYGGTSGAGNVAIDTAGDSGRGEMYIYI